nr:reverse transcriptase domain-containing protein [Tanacetum cinerariifolium]
MMTVRKRVGPLPTYRLAVRHSVDYSLSDLFTFNDSSRYSPLDLSSETSSNSSSDALSDSSSSHSSSDNSSPVLPSEDCSDKSFESSVPRETSLRDDVVIRYSDEPYSEPGIDPEIQLEIDKCIEYTDALRAEGIDARVVVETVAREEARTSMKGPVKVRVERVTHPVVPDDVLEPAQEEGVIEERISELEQDNTRLRDMMAQDCSNESAECCSVREDQVIEGVQKDQWHRIVVMSQQSVVLSERISELEQDNTRLRDMMDVASQRVTQFQQRELCGDRNKEVNRNRGVNENGGLNGNGGLNRNGGLNDNGNEGGNDNGYGNGNRGGNGYSSGSFMYVARECTYQDFLKCQPLNFNGTEGVVGLTRWFEKMETRAIGIDVAYAMRWTQLIKLMIEEISRIGYVMHESSPGVMLEVLKTREGLTITRETTVGSNQLLSDKMLEARMWQELTRHEAMRERGMLGLSTIAISAGCTMKRTPVGNPSGIICYECGRPRHYRKDCPKLRNQNRGNRTGNMTGKNKATAGDYAIRGGGGANPDSNVVTGTFLLNNCYASMLFDSGADRSFVSSTFSALLDIAPSTLDTSYVVELADERISETNVILRGCMLGLLGHPFDIDLMPVELGSFDVMIDSQNSLLKNNNI